MGISEDSVCLVKQRFKATGLEIKGRVDASITPTFRGWEEGKPEKESEGERDLGRKEERQCGGPRSECDMLGTRLCKRQAV